MNFYSGLCNKLTFFSATVREQVTKPKPHLKIVLAPVSQVTWVREMAATVPNSAHFPPKVNGCDLTLPTRSMHY